MSENTDRFQYNMAELFTCWPSTKTAQDIMIRQKNMAARGGAYFPYISIIWLFENLLVRNRWTNLNITLQ